MEPEGSLPSSQEPSTGPYPEQDQSNPYHPIHFNIVHPLTSSIEFFFITILHLPQRKHGLLLCRMVLVVFSAKLHNNGRGTDHIENSLSIVEACLPHARVS
jgi:hypothetical protein